MRNPSFSKATASAEAEAVPTASAPPPAATPLSISGESAAALPLGPAPATAAPAASSPMAPGLAAITASAAAAHPPLVTPGITASATTTAVPPPVTWERFLEVLELECRQVVAEHLAKELFDQYDERYDRLATELAAQVQPQGSSPRSGNGSGHDSGLGIGSGARGVVETPPLPPSDPSATPLCAPDSPTIPSPATFYCRAEARPEAPLPAAVVAGSGEAVPLPRWAHAPGRSTLLNPHGVRLEVVHRRGNTVAREVVARGGNGGAGGGGECAVELGRCTTVLGRDGDVRLGPLARFASRKHAALLVDDRGGLFLVDLRSTAGTALLPTAYHGTSSGGSGGSSSRSSCYGGGCGGSCPDDRARPVPLVPGVPTPVAVGTCFALERSPRRGEGSNSSEYFIRIAASSKPSKRSAPGQKCGGPAVERKEAVPAAASAEPAAAAAAATATAKVKCLVEAATDGETSPPCGPAAAASCGQHREGGAAVGRQGERAGARGPFLVGPEDAAARTLPAVLTAVPTAEPGGKSPMRYVASLTAESRARYRHPSSSPGEGRVRHRSLSPEENKVAMVRSPTREKEKKEKKEKGKKHEKNSKKHSKKSKKHSRKGFKKEKEKMKYKKDRYDRHDRRSADRHSSRSDGSSDSSNSSRSRGRERSRSRGRERSRSRSHNRGRSRSPNHSRDHSRDRSRSRDRLNRGSSAGLSCKRRRTTAPDEPRRATEVASRGARGAPSDRRG